MWVIILDFFGMGKIRFVWEFVEIDYVSDIIFI